jgi:hypothetical protein
MSETSEWVEGQMSKDKGVEGQKSKVEGLKFDGLKFGTSDLRVSTLEFPTFDLQDHQLDLAAANRVLMRCRRGEDWLSLSAEDIVALAKVMHAEEFAAERKRTAENFSRKGS